MKRKKKTYSLSVIKKNYTYNIQQIADLYEISIATIRRWVTKESLKRIPGARPHLIHGSQLYSFLEERQEARKNTCEENKAFCMKCRSTQQAKMNSGNVTVLPNKTIRFQAQCGVCNTKMNKFLKSADWTRSHSLFPYLEGALNDSNESHGSPRKCSLEEEEQLCLSLTQ